MENRQKTLEKLTAEKTASLVAQEKKRNNCFDGQIIQVFNIITILKKIDDYICDLETQLQESDS